MKLGDMIMLPLCFGTYNELNCGEDYIPLSYFVFTARMDDKTGQQND